MWLFYLEDTYRDNTSHTNRIVMTRKGESTFLHLSQCDCYKYTGGKTQHFSTATITHMQRGVNEHKVA